MGYDETLTNEGTIMNNREKLAVATTIGTAAVLTYSYIKNMKAQKAIREEIDRKLAHDLRALHRAGENVQRRIKDGYYDKTGLAAIQQDFQFEYIIAANDMK
jgi:hypothetical protein